MFAPTGESKKSGEVNAYVFSSLNTRPSLAGGNTWLGSNFGFLSPANQSSEIPHFGGFEAGFDLLYPTSYPGDPQTVKPVLNFKMQFLTESTYSPHAAVGFMDFAPFKISRGSNIAYLSLTKRISMSKNYGRLTLGVGNSFSNDVNVFFSTAPLPEHTQMIIGGYESPDFGPISFGADYFGGISESSSTNFIMNYALPVAVLSIGVFVSNDQTTVANNYDGFFISVEKTWGSLKVE